MERFSRFRDAGTGIQVFLPPVSPATSNSAAAAVLAPLTAVLGVIRLALVLVVGLLWTALLFAISPLGARWTSSLNSVLGRAVLACIGLPIVQTEVVSVKGRGRPQHSTTSAGLAFAPQRGDVILCNWSSWIDVLILATRFDPIFVRPIVQPRAQATTGSNAQGTSASRRKNAATRGQQHAQMPAPQSGQTAGEGQAQAATGEERILGWRATSWLEMVLRSGLTPEASEAKSNVKALDAILKEATRPVVVFPELVTSNNRGILRFESVFPPSWRSLYRATGAVRIGKGQPNIFIMALKHDPPTQFAPSTTLSVPSSMLSPLPHLVRLCFTPYLLRPYSLSVRLLPADETPTHAAYVADAGAGTQQRGDALGEKCADLMSSVSRLRRTGIDWQEKEAFLEMCRRRM